MHDLKVTASESRGSIAPRLRVAIVTETYPPEVNGVAMTLGRIVAALLQRGHVVQLLRPRQFDEVSPSEQVDLEQVLFRGMPIPTYPELRVGFPSRSRLLKLWKQKRPDIVHVVTEGPLGWSAVNAAHVLHLPVSSSFHTNFQSYSRYYGMGWFRTLIEGYLRRLHNRTLATMVPTRAMMQDLQALAFDRVTLLARGVETRQFSADKRSQGLRERWGVGADDLVIMNVGRLAKEKNIGVVVAAFKAIAHRLPTARLVFVGDGPERKQLKENCPTAIYAGVQQGEALAMHYASADVFLFPSLTETFGNVVPEALASGLAVVSYDRAAARELITTELNGVAVPGNAEIDFIEAALSLALNRQRQSTMRKNAAASVAHLHWDAIYDRFVEVLSDVIQLHGQQHAGAASIKSLDLVESGCRLD
ncbi:MAG: glycosyltransferase family 1 protein [Rhodoferax sp.]|uniref:glycosyltransferase family 4 protein n=1 Tax=Rhodoferax sp. TaxID=50421 RepID=UPI003BB1020C